MDNKEYTELMHSKDTAGYLIYDVHCPYCRKGEHSEDKYPPQEKITFKQNIYE